MGTTDRDEWRDLSDSEIRSRLIHRGVEPGDAFLLVRMRDEPFGDHEIESVLNG